MKKITKAFIGAGILLSGIGAAVAIGKKATESGVDDKYFEDESFDEIDDDYIDEDVEV